MASDSAIWRATSVGAEGSNGSDTIDFNDLTLADNQQIGLIQSQTTLSTGIGVNPKPKSAVDELQDTGFAGATITLTGSIKDPSNNGLNPAHLLKTWSLEDKTNSSFPFGRFGLRMGDFNAFDLTPNTNRGYMLSDVTFIRDGETRGKLQVVITLRFNGSIGSPVGGKYLW